MKEQIKSIAQQVNWRELKMRGFKFMYDDEKLTFGIIKGSKHFIISLDDGRDLYNVRKVITRKFEITHDDKIEGIFCDQIADMIERFFKFDYLNKPRFG